MPHLIFVAHAVAPGPGGAEGLVNARLLRALAQHWRGGVSVITGGGIPSLENGGALSDVPGWNFHALGVHGGQGEDRSLLNRATAWCLEETNSGGIWRAPAKAMNRLTYYATGSGLKMTSWREAASRALRQELERHPEAVVFSRALPFASVAAAGVVRRERRFPWIVNINDPLPPDVWPHSFDDWSCRRMRAAMRRTIPMISAVTFPSQQLYRMERNAFPELSRIPALLLPHITRSPASATNGNGGRADALLRIAYAGTMNGGRARPELTAALREFAAAAADRMHKLQFSFYLNSTDEGALKLIKSLPVRKNVFVGSFGEESDEALLAADVLLDVAADEDMPLLNTKTATYVGYRKPIWAICKPQGTTWNLVQRGWGYASVAGDVRSIVRTLDQIYQDWSNGSLSSKGPAPEIVERFSAKRQVDDLRALCEQLAGARNGSTRTLAGPLNDWP